MKTVTIVDPNEAPYRTPDGQAGDFSFWLGDYGADEEGADEDPYSYLGDVDDGDEHGDGGVRA
jgi:hypothetical protein